MASVSSSDTYKKELLTALNFALCIRRFPSLLAERQVVPEVELQVHQELILPPILIVNQEKEACLIEPSINSVRVSLRLNLGPCENHANQLKNMLTEIFMRFLGQQADMLCLLRRLPVPGYHISFLVTDKHLIEFGMDNISDFISGFVEMISEDILDLESMIRHQGIASFEICGDSQKKNEGSISKEI